jgi:hypothetical protein
MCETIDAWSFRDSDTWHPPVTSGHLRNLDANDRIPAFSTTIQLSPTFLQLYIFDMYSHSPTQTTRFSVFTEACYQGMPF